MVYVHCYTGGLCLSIYLFLLLGIHYHGSTEAVVPFGSHQDIVVWTGFTALPELIIIGEFGEGYRLIAQSAINFHHRQAGGQTK